MSRDTTDGRTNKRRTRKDRATHWVVLSLWNLDAGRLSFAITSFYVRPCLWIWTGEKHEQEESPTESHHDCFSSSLSFFLVIVIWQLLTIKWSKILISTATKGTFYFWIYLHEYFQILRFLFKHWWWISKTQIKKTTDEKWKWFSWKLVSFMLHIWTLAPGHKLEEFALLGRTSLNVQTPVVWNSKCCIKVEAPPPPLRPSPPPPPAPPCQIHLPSSWEQPGAHSSLSPTTARVGVPPSSHQLWWKQLVM